MKKIVVLSLLNCSFTASTQAALVARGKDMVYDTVNNITWAVDANLFKTQSASNSNLVSEIIAVNGGVIHETPNISDTFPNSGIHTLTPADFSVIGGKLTWWGAQAWANTLTLGGVTGWTLPTSIQQNDFFIKQLGNVSGYTIKYSHNRNYNLFFNVQSYLYWSNSEITNEPYRSRFFNTTSGHQDSNGKSLLCNAWVVHSGDVAASQQVSAR